MKKCIRFFIKFMKKLGMDSGGLGRVGFYKTYQDGGEGIGQDDQNLS